MKKLLAFCAFICLLGSVRSMAEDLVAVNTIQMMYPDVVSEPDPNNELYNFTFKGADSKGKKWRVQIKYTSPIMYGVFEDADFYNLDGSVEAGAYYNYIRTDDGMSFFPFKHLNATIVHHADSIVIDMNGLYKNRNDEWERVLVHAFVPTPAPTDTIYADLGRVATMPHMIYESLYLDAGNEEYSLAFGISGQMSLSAGTYYTADLLKPEFVRVAQNDTIESASAELNVRDTTDGYHALTLQLYSVDNVLYVLDMHTGKPEITDTVTVDCLTGGILEQAEFNMFQIYGEGNEYNAAVSVTRGVIENGLRSIPRDSILLAYTAVANRTDLIPIRIEEADALLETSEETGVKTLRATLYGTNGTLYKVSIPLGHSYLPEAKDTINIDFGDGVGRVDYSQGLGLIGFVLANESNVDVHVSAIAGMKLSGTIYSDYFNYDGCYITTYSEESTRFTDIKAAQMTLDSVGDVLHITLDAITITDTLYHMTARLQPKYALTGTEIEYSVALTDDVSMIALTTDSLVYRMQFQRADQWTEDYEPLGNYELWTFSFLAEKPYSIAGTYGFSAGNLDMAQLFVLYEDGTEIYLAPVAGTLTLTCIDELTIPLDNQSSFKTHIYSIEANVLAENGRIYHLQGDNFLLCVNAETGEFVEIPESSTALNDALEERGFVVRKVLRNGQILIERAEGTYNMQGARQE